MARKVMNANLPAEDQIKDCGATKHCPNCLCLIDNTDVAYDWPGLPAGVKFDPSDVELLDHLSSKQGVGNLQPHVYIDEFIPTIEGDEGICYTHPENLPGAKRDGSSVHFFYRIRKAYASGRRKRRRVQVQDQDQESTNSRHVRWHKTGKTKLLTESGAQKGFKKIMVLYAASKKGSKPEKCNWVMHQYHLGTDENEKDGEFVVCKIFFQQKETEKNEASLVDEVSDINTVHVVPRTPGTDTFDLPRLEKTPSSDCLSDEFFIHTIVEEAENLKDPYHTSYDSRFDYETEYATSLAEDTDSIDLSRNNTLSCSEIVHSSAAFDDDLKPTVVSLAQVGLDASAVHESESNKCSGIAELANLDLDTPPDFDPNDLIFTSQDSIFDWLDRA